MFTNPSHAYDAGRKMTASSRELEAAALFKAARLLEACQQSWGRAGAGDQLDQALGYNQRLWTLFQCELEAPDHPLPSEIRLNLLRLSAFVDRRTWEIRADPAPEKLQALVDLNRMIGSGLALPAGAAGPG
ncbi:MAG TPA: flagellar biosynthesis regulator FlaF [Gemmatimonadales bacterium]|jgi:flagellar protein FlaF|nr:flagellar biosynthesis regulator FlaF [Gemmatimonadales bacterium]